MQTMDITYNEAIEIIRDYIDHPIERFDVPNDWDEMDLMRCEMEIEGRARGYQQMLACDPEKFVEDVNRSELWYSFSYGIGCDLHR